MNLFLKNPANSRSARCCRSGRAYQVETAGGKRTKVKVRTLLHYENRRRTAARRCQAIAADVDFEFLWEVAGQDEFGFADSAPNTSATAAARRGRRPGAGAARRAYLFYKKGAR
jgi:hypothetical protein